VEDLSAFVYGKNVHVYSAFLAAFALAHRAMTAARACALVRALLGPAALPPTRPKLAIYSLISFETFTFFMVLIYANCLRIATIILRFMRKTLIIKAI
jgi:hypothetical protein